MRTPRPTASHVRCIAVQQRQRGVELWHRRLRTRTRPVVCINASPCENTSHRRAGSMSYGPPEGGPHNHRVRLKAGPTISVRPEADPTLAAFTTAAWGSMLTAATASALIEVHRDEVTLRARRDRSSAAMPRPTGRRMWARRSVLELDHDAFGEAESALITCDNGQTDRPCCAGRCASPS